MENLDQIQLWALMAAVGYVGYLLGRASRNETGEDRTARRMREREEAENLFGGLAPEVQAQVDDRLHHNKTIEAIKIVREHSGAGLKDAKLAVDARKAAMGKR